MHIVMTVHGTEVAAPAARPFSRRWIAQIGVGMSGNGVFEIGEGAVVVGAVLDEHQRIRGFALTGAPSNFTGPGAGVAAFYTIPDSRADYGSRSPPGPANCLTATGDCYLVNIGGNRGPVPGPPGRHDRRDADAGRCSDRPRPMLIKTWTLHVGESFTDVSTDLGVDPFYPFIETIFHKGVTSRLRRRHDLLPAAEQPAPGDGGVPAQGLLGSGYVPPDCTGIFEDVPCPATPEFPYSNFVEDLSTRGITTGCQVGPPALFCPGRHVTRAQMSVFLLKTLLGGAYAPPDCTGIFADVPCPATPEFPYSNFIEDLSTRGITAGCQVGPPALFCPDNPVTRQEMAVFLSLTLTSYGPRVFVETGVSSRPRETGAVSLCAPGSGDAPGDGDGRVHRARPARLSGRS